MDVQGDLSIPALTNVLNLTNCVIVHVSAHDLEDNSIKEIIVRRLDIMKNANPNIYFFIIIKDAMNNRILKNSLDIDLVEQTVDDYDEKVSHFPSFIDCIVEIMEIGLIDEEK